MGIMRENTIRLLCSNVRGLVCNWHVAESFDWNLYDIVAFNEVWQIKNFENIVKEGFEVKTCRLRENSRGGGTVIFTKIGLEVKPLVTPFIEGTIETTGIKIGRLNFINIYRPPNGNKDQFTDTLMQYLDTLGGQQILIGGDFNLNLIGGNTWIKSICDAYRLEAKIRDITRIESSTCIDNYLTNVDGSFLVNELMIADHQAITAELKLAYCKAEKEVHMYREMKESNWLLFNHNIHNLVVSGETIEDRWTSLLQGVKTVVDDSFPIKQTTRKYHFTMSQGLLKSKDKKNKLLRQYKQGRIPKEEFTRYNSVYRKLIKTEQSTAFSNNLQAAGNNGKLKWKVIKAGLNMQKSKESILEVNLNGNLISDKNEIAAAFKSHFETCATDLAVGLPQGNDTSSVMPQGENWSFEPTTTIDLLKIIRTLLNKNSSGHDCLSNRMLKKEAYAFSVLLAPLINDSIALGIFPSGLKTANVLPIFKKGDTTNLNNFRPIALLPVFSKVFEKVLNKQLTKVIESGYIDENQFGFRTQHSTEDAVLKFVDKIENDLAQGNHVVTVYLDVSKAFDSCDHSILLNKLRRTGLDNMGIKLMESYLKDRKQIVIVNGVNGGFFIINIGVGQGTVLGPTLFKVYIMDLHLHTKLFCVKFADDSSLEAAAKSRDAVERLVNSELQKVSSWFKNNRLTLHPGKSRFLVHSRDKLIRLFIDNNEVQRCGYGLQEESVKLLGVKIDENLDWKEHIKEVSKKISKGNYLLWRHKKKLTMETRKLLYESFIRSHLLYCITVWGGAKKGSLKPVTSMLSRAWKKMGRYKQHTLPRLKALKILKFEDELAVQEEKLIWKWEKSKTPKGLNKILIEKVDQLRGRRFVKYTRAKQESINFRLASRADKVITKVSQLTSKRCVTTHARNDLFNTKYNFSCTVRNCFICRS